MLNEQQKTQLDSELKIIRAVADAIKEAGRIPSGHLYAFLIGQGWQLDDYQKLIGLLKRSGLIREEYHELIWNLKEGEK